MEIQTYQGWTPFGEARNFPADQLTSEGKDAWQRWQDAEQGVQTLHKARKDAVEAATLAREALDAEIEKSAETGVPGQEVKLTVKLNACIAEADPEIHDRRIKRAESLAYTAQQSYEQHLANNLDEYLALLEPLAVEVATQIVEATAAYEQKIGPLHAPCCPSIGCRSGPGPVSRFRPRGHPLGLHRASIPL
jgi:hypothetical protein